VEDIPHGIDTAADGHPHEIILELACEGSKVSVFEGS
jgi:hypothetical protein